jgi:HPt (histidine-containing phosphotransfer) domain-containing protein/uncharacterized membrane-anchored protein YhcB (DUF1043 family)
MKLDKNMGMLVGAIVLIVLTLGGSLFLSLRAMNQVTDGMTTTVIPIEDELNGVSDSLASSFEWQSRINATGDKKSYDETVASRGEETLEAHLERLRSVVEASDADVPEGAEDRLATLEEELIAFREQQSKLSSSVGRRHELNARFNERVQEVNGDLGSFLQRLESLQGRVRLEYVSKLADLDQEVNGTTVAAITHGSDRATYDALQDLRPDAVRLGFQLGKIGLTNDKDALNSIVANEVGPTVGSVKRRLDDIQELVEGNPGYAAEVRELRTDFMSVVELGSGESADSLRGLRRSILDELATASDVRNDFQLTASNLSTGAKAVQSDAKQMVNALEEFAVVSMSRSQWISILAGLVALIAVGIALGRIAQSVRSLEEANAELVGLKNELENANAVLETKVQERTEALAQREVAVRGLLNGLAEGVLEVSLDGQARDERSSVVAEWFGGQPEGLPACDYLFEEEAKQVAFQMGLEQIEMDILPVELCIDQMPGHRILSDGRVLEFDYRPASNAEDEVQGVLVIMQDVTARLEAERAQRETQDFQRLVQQILQDRDGFVRFVEDGSSLLAKIQKTEKLGVVKLGLHTLKGNCAVYGASELAELCHNLESTLQNAAEADEARLPTPAEVQSLHDAWERMLQRVAVFSTTGEEARVSVLREELEHVAKQLRVVDASLSDRLERWLLESVDAELERLGRRASRVADKLGKSLEVEVRGNGIRTTPGFARELLGELVHVVRNAVDHGIESADIRAARGKDAAGSMWIEATASPGELRLSISDDGAGVNWERLRAIAKERGLPHTTHRDLVEVMFSSGVSTAERVTEISGRGVGTTATKKACEALGGRIEVSSKPQEGTQITFILPVPKGTKVVSEAGPAAPLERAS